MPAFIDLTGQVFTRLTVISRGTAAKSGRLRWLCECVCGNTTLVETNKLKSAHTRSCGCLVIDLAGQQNRKHGHSTNGRRSPEFNIWHAMIQRTTNPRNSHFKNYGGRGIAVAPEWLSFPNFLASVGLRPHPDLTLDRIDNDGPYAPHNTRWTTYREQANNKTNNRMLTHNGKTQTLIQWAREIGISYNTLHSRLGKLGWTITEALTISVFKPQNKKS